MRCIVVLRRSERLSEIITCSLAFESTQIDPTRPQATWRTSWRHFTRVVLCPACKRLLNPSDGCSDANCKTSLKDLKSPLAGLRFHDLRRHVVTELAETQEIDATGMSIAWHLSQKLLQRHSHVRLQAKRTALNSLSMDRPMASDFANTIEGYDTHKDTSESRSRLRRAKNIDSLVELSGIEPLTSSLRTRRSPN
jgi:hypothetical protein